MAARSPTFWLVDDPSFDQHQNPFEDHPERPARLIAARQAVANARNKGVLFQELNTKRSAASDLLAVHEEMYLDAFWALRGARTMLDPETFLGPQSVDAAEMAAGGAVALVDAICRADGPQQGFALLRPPGHHATPQTGMGFCLLNNVAIAARHAQRGDIARVAIVDWDVHHGNGTQDVFYGDPSVLYTSIHQYPMYPGTGDAADVGEGDGIGTTVNVPLSAYASDVTYAAAFDRILLPIIDDFKPDLILISAGFDAHIRDPLSGMSLSGEGFGVMAKKLGALAQKHCEGRLGVFLEGGYDLHGIRESMEQTIMALSDDPNVPSSALEPGSDGVRVASVHRQELRRAAKLQKPHWKIV